MRVIATLALAALMGGLAAHAAEPAGTSAHDTRAATQESRRTGPIEADLVKLVPEGEAEKRFKARTRARNKLQRYNSDGVNCSHYPARCR